MKRMFPLAVLLFAATLNAADVPVQQVAGDAKVIDRVAQAAKRDLPQDLLKRILTEDIELLRGKRADGSYDFATYERLESSRSDRSYSVPARKSEALEHFEIKGSFVYRLIIDSPSRRLLVTKNRRVFIDHVELEYIPMASSTTQRQTIKVEAWMEPGETRPIDFPEVARQATARVFARGDEKAGYGNIVLTLITSRVVDNADSPYADAVASAKAMLRAIDNADIPSIRSMASRMYADLESRLAVAAPPPAAVAAPQSATPPTVTAAVVTPPVPSATTVGVGGATDSTASGEIFTELQTVEDLLTGNDAERREGMDRLHQLLRRLRPH